MERITKVKDFIRESLMDGIEGIGKGFPYHAFALESIAIEFLGKVMAKENWSQDGNSRKDFKNAIETLFPNKYHHLSSFLYEELRCGMLHFFGPKSKLVLGTTQEDGKHLSLTPSGKVILILEEFHKDFKEAAEKLLTTNNQKLEETFLQIGKTESM
jgi:hypothetical protein